MKFIEHHDETKEMLGGWAQGANLETPSFFFWNSGDPGQRSQEGLEIITPRDFAETP